MLHIIILLGNAYEIHGWVKAEHKNTSSHNKATYERWEFIGRKAPQDIRDRYVGKIINYNRSYSSHLSELEKRTNCR